MSTRDHNRRCMPAMTAFLDHLREELGDGVQLIYAHEGVYEAGRDPRIERIGTTAGGHATVQVTHGTRRIGPRAQRIDGRDDHG